MNFFEVVFGAEEEKEPFARRTKTSDEMLLEVAYHEASHFVFGVMSLKYVTGFIGHIFMRVCPENFIQDNDENGNGYNVVNGFAPDVPLHKTYVRSQREEPNGYLEFYNEDRKRLVAKMLVTLAGYSSYQIFNKGKQEDEYFVGIPPELDEVKTERKRIPIFDLTYYDNSNLQHNPASDFQNASKKLRIYYELNPDERNEAIKKLIGECQELMEIQAVNESIRYVKNRFLERECELIEGEELQEIIEEVQRLTNNVSLSEILEKYEYEI